MRHGRCAGERERERERERVSENGEGVDVRVWEAVMWLGQGALATTCICSVAMATLLLQLLVGAA